MENTEAEVTDPTPEELDADTPEKEGTPTEKDGEGRDTKAETSPDKPADQAPDKDGDRTNIEARYKSLQGEFTRRSQENADLKRRVSELESLKTQLAELPNLQKQAQALQTLSQNPKFRAWAEQEILAQQYGGADFDQLEPQQKLAVLNQIAERKAAEIVEQKLQAFRGEFEPAKAAQAENQAREAITKVAEKWGDLWESRKEKVSAIVAEYDKLALNDPSVRSQMNNVTPDFVEKLFLSTFQSPDEIRELGKLAYKKDLEKRRKAQVAGGGNAADGALATKQPKSIDEAFALAKQQLKVSVPE